MEDDSKAAQHLLKLLSPDQPCGQRVIRGRNWRWWNQDGGFGGVGTVNKLTKGDSAIVVWDNGKRHLYRAGADGYHDLRVVGNATVGVEHPNSSCNMCREDPIKGIRWNCKKCGNYDLCSQCYHGGKHYVSHPFYRIDEPTSNRVEVGARLREPRVQLRGIFPGAQVLKGGDWKWGNHNGRGDAGTVKKILDDREQTTFQSIAAVHWPNSRPDSLFHYRVGHKGFVDLKVTLGADGGLCYYEHLPDFVYKSSCTRDGASKDNLKGSAVPQASQGYDLIYGGDNDTDDSKIDAYHPGLSRQLAEEKLKGPDAKQGTFLVRDSISVRDALVLSVRDVDEVKHYCIDREGCNLTMSTTKASFSSLDQLLQHYSQPGSKGIPLLHERFHERRDERDHCNYTVSSRSADAWETQYSALTDVEPLGQGNFGDVHVGVWNNSKRVAIKRLKKDAGNNSVPADFLKEAERMKILDHEHVVKLYAICKDPFLIVMEYLEKGSLLDYMKAEQQTIKLTDLRRLAGQVASGMAYLESKLVIHRDLAARNVLISVDGIAKVADFGLSCCIQEPDGVYSTRNKYLFPVRWTAPESAETGEYTTKSDVWSFGIVLTELVTYGQIPYADQKDNPTVLSMVKSGYRMPQPSGCPPDLYKMMQDCWHQDASKRPSFTDLKGRLGAKDEDAALRREPRKNFITSLSDLIFGKHKSNSFRPPTRS